MTSTTKKRKTTTRKKTTTRTGKNLTKSKKKTKATRTGASCSRRVLLGLLGWPAAAADKKKKDSDKKLVSVVAGTVFRDPGFAVAGAEIELLEVRADGRKSKPQRTVTDGRGEFAFRLPPGEVKYKVKATAKGLQSEEKETTTAPGVRMDVFFTLKPASN